MIAKLLFRRRLLLLAVALTGWATCLRESSTGASEIQGTARTLAVAPARRVEGPERRWAVVIGVSDYANSEIEDLRYARTDAEAIAEALERRCGFPKSQIRLLTDGAATHEAMATALGTWLPGVAGPNDTVLIYFSGHGAPDVYPYGDADGFRKYLVAADSNPNSLFGTALPLDELSAALEKLRCGRTTVLLDCCYGGAALGRGTAGAARALFRPTVKAEGRLKGDFISKLAGAASRFEQGVAVLSACGPNELSWEYPDLKRGIFTHYVLRGIEGEAANPQGEVTADGLYAYLSRKMSTPGNERAIQTPMASIHLAGKILLVGADPGAPAGKGRVRLLTSPLGAKVYIDGEARPLETPFETELPFGEHRVTIYKPGYLPLTAELQVPPNQTVHPHFVLRPEHAQGDLLIAAPGGAQVVIDDSPAATVDDVGLLRLTGLTGGEHRVVISANGFRKHDQSVRLRAGGVTVVTFNPTPEGPGLPQQLPSGMRREGERFFWIKDGAEMVFVPGGEFLMGRDDEPDARPQHMRNSPAFWIDRQEITNEQFARFVAEGGWKPRGGWQSPGPAGDKLPAVRVTLEDALAYARWAGRMVPSEEQWEKAARGTDGRLFPAGESIDPRMFNVRASQLGRPTAGGFFRGESPYKALDMLGNVQEWCNSPYAPYPGNSARVPGFGTGQFVTRGGSFQTLGFNLCIPHRFFMRSDDSRDDLGFRCVVPQTADAR